MTQPEGWVAYPATGISMGSRWQGARLLLAEPVARSAPRWADVVIYRAGGGLVAHRLVRWRTVSGSRQALTKGDGCLLPDRIPVPVASIVAVVRAVEFTEHGLDLTRRASRCRGVLHAAGGWLASWIWSPRSGTAAVHAVEKPR